MCLKTIDKFTCGDTTLNNPVVADMVDIEKCPAWNGETCPKLREQEQEHDGPCPECNGEADFEKLWYKWCDQSLVCDHEYNHHFTDLRRFPQEEDIVLVNPMPGLCPECGQAGYNIRPGAVSASKMPEDFENLERGSMADIPRISVIPSSSVHPLADENNPLNAYNPGASRHPTVAGSKVPTYHTQALAGEQRIPSQYPALGLPIRQSQVPHAHTPSQRPTAFPSTRPSNFSPNQKPSTRPSEYPDHAHSPSQRPPSEYPKEAHQGSRQPITIPSIKPQATPSTRPSIHSPSTQPSTIPKDSPRTKAPPSHEPGPDLEKLLSSVSIIPSHYPSKAPARTEKGHTAYPVEQAPRGRSQIPGQSWVPAASKTGSMMPNQGTKMHSQVPGQRPSKAQPHLHSGSKAPLGSHSQTPRAQSQIPGQAFKAEPSRVLRTVVPGSSGPALTPEEEAAQLARRAAEMLKRGPPKNVGTSAFYDNADGNAAREQLQKAKMSVVPEENERVGKK